MLKFLKAHIAEIIVVVGLCLFAFFAIAERAPVNMDEFSHYHPLICHFFPNNSLNTFREACGYYDLVLPFFSEALPLRSYGYSGVTPSLIYLPLYLLWSSPESLRMLGFVFLLVQAGAVGRIIKQKFVFVAPALALFFPLVYQNMIDTGIVALYGVGILYSILFINKWFEKFRFRYILGLALVLFLSLYTRLSFVFGVPALVLYFLALVIKNFKTVKHKLKKILPQLAWSGTILMALIGFYFLSTTATDPPYHPLVRQVFRFPGRSLSELVNPQTYLDAELFDRFVNPLEAVSRNYELAEPGVLEIIYSVILFGVPVTVFLTQFVRGWLAQKKLNWKILQLVNKRSALFFALFLVTAWFLFRSTGATHTHHAVLSYPFLVLAWGFLWPDLASKLGRVPRLLVLALLALFNLFYFATYVNNPVLVHDDASKVTVNKILNNDYLAQNYIYAVADWGLYYYQGLYGDKEQAVIYLEGEFEKPETYQALALQALATGREHLYLVNKKEPTLAVLQQKLPELTECSLTKDSPVWGIFLRPDANQANPCR